MLSISYLNKLPYKGSYNGKRFMFEKNENKETKEKSLKVYLWKDLYNFENTPDEDKKVKEFEFNNEGISSGLDFVEETSI